MNIELSINEYNRLVEQVKNSSRLDRGILVSFFFGIFISIIWCYLTWKLSASYGFFLLILAYVISIAMKYFSNNSSIISVVIALLIYLLHSSASILLNAWILFAFHHEIDIFTISSSFNWGALSFILVKMFYPIDALFFLFSIILLVLNSRFSIQQRVKIIYLNQSRYAGSGKLL